MGSPLNIWDNKHKKYVPLPCLKGDNGYTPQKGVDYFTKEDIKEILSKTVIVKGNGTDSIQHNNNTAVADGNGSISLGMSKSYNENGITMGRDNTNYSHCGINLGYRNLSGLEEYKDTQWNVNGALGCVVLGWDNKATHSFVTMLGDHNISSRNHQVIFGTCCAENPDAIFVVGNGDELYSGIRRSNLFEVTYSDVIFNNVALPKEEIGECMLWLGGRIDTKSQYHRVGNLVSIMHYRFQRKNITESYLKALPFAISNGNAFWGQGFVTFDESMYYPIFARGFSNATYLILYVIVDNLLKPISHQLFTELSGSTEYTADIELNIQYLTEV